jgi:Lon protease-like protein
MQNGLLPLFPLQVVLFPGSELPLHIFEDRYREMIAEVLRDKLEFGVVLASEKGIVNTGCTATVDKVLKEYADGRMDILTRGRRRFEILMLNEERTFLRGAVDFFDDDKTDPAAEDMRSRAMESFQALLALSKDDAPAMGSAPGADDPQLSFRLAQAVPDLGFRQALLAMRSEADRMRQLVDFLPNYVSKQKQIRHIKDLAPRNGHGHGLGAHGKLE